MDGCTSDDDVKKSAVGGLPRHDSHGVPERKELLKNI